MHACVIMSNPPSPPPRSPFPASAPIQRLRYKKKNLLLQYDVPVLSVLQHDDNYPHNARTTNNGRPLITIPPTLTPPPPLLAIKIYRYDRFLHNRNIHKKTPTSGDAQQLCMLVCVKYNRSWSIIYRSWPYGARFVRGCMTSTVYYHARCIYFILCFLFVPQPTYTQSQSPSCRAPSAAPRRQTAEVIASPPR